MPSSAPGRGLPGTGRRSAGTPYLRLHSAEWLQASEGRPGPLCAVSETAFVVSSSIRHPLRPPEDQRKDALLPPRSAASQVRAEGPVSGMRVPGDQSSRFPTVL